MDEWVTLEEVYQAYRDCRRRKRGTESCATFEIDEAKNLYELWEDLNNGTYEIGYSNTFCVTRPKVREVFAADFRDRIIHHLLMQKTMPLFEEYFIDDTFNCRKGYGTMAAHRRAQMLGLEYADGWVLKCDISGFFMSIPKEELANRLERFILDRYKGDDISHIIELSRRVALHRPELKCKKKGDLKLWKLLPQEKSLFTCGDGLGMAIGNLTSQIYANFYLSQFDHWMEEQGFGYCRYVDDFIVFSHDRDKLVRLIPKIRRYLIENDKLKLHPNKIELQQVRKGFPFVGVYIKKGRIYIGNRTVGNCFSMIAKYNELSSREMMQSVDKFCQRYNSYTGFMLHYSSYAIRWRIWEQVDDRVRRYVYLTGRMAVMKARHKYKRSTIIKKRYYDLRKHSRQ